MDLLSIRTIFTPSVLFVLLNLVIGSIAVISTRHRRHQYHNQQQHGGGPRPISRSSSSNVLERVRSLGLFRFRSGDLPPIVTTDESDTSTSTTVDSTHHHHHVVLQQDPDTSSRLQEYEIGHSQHQHQHQHQFRRIQSESDSKVKESCNTTIKMKKSVSSTTSSRRSEEVPERRPAATKLRREASVDEEVDAKADDFINRFKQQLKLQRLDSILRYKEMLTNKK